MGIHKAKPTPGPEAEKPKTRRTLSGRLVTSEKRTWHEFIGIGRSRPEPSQEHPSRKHDTNLRVVPTSIEVTHADKGAPRRRVRRMAARSASH